MDEYCLGVLLYMFNPVITSLRDIQQASELRNVQKKLGIKRVRFGLRGKNGDRGKTGTGLVLDCLVAFVSLSGCLEHPATLPVD